MIYYTISNIYTGYHIGHWDSYEAAEYHLLCLDDWMDWIIDEQID